MVWYSLESQHNKHISAQHIVQLKIKVSDNAQIVPKHEEEVNLSQQNR